MFSAFRCYPRLCSTFCLKVIMPPIFVNIDHSILPLSTSCTVYKKLKMSEKEWSEKLTKDQYYVLRQKGTEAPFTGKYYNHSEKGTYTCVGCGVELFSSSAKYDSGSGWPSFFDTIESFENKSVVNENSDSSLGILRTEVTCQQCDAHLGHVFNDGPKPTGLRYCINSASLNFKEDKK